MNDLTRLLVPVLLIGAGVFSIVCSLRGSRFFWEHRRAQFMVRVLGHTGAKVFYIVDPEKVFRGCQHGAGTADWRNIITIQRTKKKILAASRASFARIRRMLCPAALKITFTQSPSLPRR